MTLGRPLAPLELTESDREQLVSMARSRSLPHGLVRRAEIVLLAAEGWPNEAGAELRSASSSNAFSKAGFLACTMSGVQGRRGRSRTSR